MEAAQCELERMRRSSGEWEELRYERATGADGHDCDRNAVRRAKALWALQYDRKTDDLPLIRWLAEQEARCRHEAPFQGLSEETELAGFLLAEHRQVEDVWLHWEIKRANFDTWCGYDLEYLFAAGVRATIAFVRDSGHADQDSVLELLLDGEGRSCVSEEGLAEWSQRQRSRFPTDPADEDPLTWVERAKLAGDRELALRELARWAAGRQRDKATLAQLRYQLADLEAYAEAARVQRESLVYADTPWDSASAWQTLAGLERRAGDHHAAWEALRECRRALDGVSGWTEVGWVVCMWGNCSSWSAPQRMSWPRRCSPRRTVRRAMCPVCLWWCCGSLPTRPTKSATRPEWSTIGSSAIPSNAASTPTWPGSPLIPRHIPNPTSIPHERTIVRLRLSAQVCWSVEHLNPAPGRWHSPRSACWHLARHTADIQ